MSQLMEQAIEKARQLPEADQEALASIMLEEIESEQRWNELFARPESADLLSRMADQALAGRGRAGLGSSTSMNYEFVPPPGVPGPVPGSAGGRSPAGPASLRAVPAGPAPPEPALPSGPSRPADLLGSRGVALSGGGGAGGQRHLLVLDRLARGV